MSQSNESRRKRREERKKNGLCTMCGKRPPKEGGATCTTCRRYYAAYRAKRRKRGRCPKCGIHKPKPGWKQCERCLTRARGYNEQLRDEVFAAYGGYRCNCPGCNERRKEFLQIDHVHNDGAAHRRKIGRTSIYGWLKKHGFPPGFQVLCANCNYAKGFYGYCPHNPKDREVTHVPRKGRRASPADAAV